MTPQSDEGGGGGRPPAVRLAPRPTIVELGLRVAVTGGRDWRDRWHVWSFLDEFHERRHIAVLIHGDCPTGVDHYADRWALARGVQAIPEPADWERHGRAAGPIRNQLMIDEHRPQILIAFPGRKGTTDMIRRARKARIEVVSSL